jgi:23S rRNA (cytidine1920-2'-O)/16S rRNA (cytidine1409-2'-O)-methyltransferase
VIGVDVGHDQLHERLKSDPRVVGVEGLNARAMTAESLVQGCEDALSEVIEEQEDNDTAPGPLRLDAHGGHGR